MQEAEEILRSAERCFVSLASGTASPELLSEIFRAMHNLKGSGYAVGFKELGEFAHKFENAIAAIRNGKLGMSPEVIDTLLLANDHAANFIKALRADLSADYDTSAIECELVRLLERPSAQSVPSAAVARPTEVTSTTLEPAMAEELTPGAAPISATGSVSSAAPSANGEESQAQKLTPSTAVTDEKNSSEDVPPSPAEVNGAATPAPGNFRGARVPKSKAKRGGADEIIRVSLNRLDNSLNLIGELVVYQNILQESMKAVVGYNDSHMNAIMARLASIVKGLQYSSYSLRMIPTDSVFNKMRRIVHDLSQTQKKPIDFLVLGETTLLDKTVVEAISDPLTHLIRNAIDHGIENPAERLQAGKPVVSQLVLCAKQENGKAIIEVKDDGRGLEMEKIRKKAIEKGIIGDGDPISETELQQLIFRSGFSTKEQVTELSGRGVGMDVVRSNVEALSGEIQIESVAGRGSTFRISLPLSLAIIEGMVCEFSQQRYIVPLNHLHETVQVEPCQLGMVGQKGATVRLRQEEIPYYDLEHLLGVASAPRKLDEPFFAFVSLVGGKKYLFAVKRFLGTQQIVTKPIGLEHSQLTGLSGSAIMGDGTPGIILNIPAIVKQNIMGVHR